MGSAAGGLKTCRGDRVDTVDSPIFSPFKQWPITLKFQHRRTPMNSKTIIPVKASPLEFAVDTTAEDAFVSIISACLNHAQANLGAVLDGQMEGVHQMRVGFRRLRSGLKLFRPLIPREASQILVEEIRWLNGLLGPARDWDVFLYEGLAPLFDYFPRKRGLHLFRVKAEAIRQTHYRLLRAALVEPRYAAISEHSAAWLAQRDWRGEISDREEKRLAEPIARFATPLLEKDHRRVVKRGEAFAQATPEQRHALRIRIKEIRYALDFFASLYPASVVKPYLASLAKLQDCLGVMNDISVAHRLLDEAGAGAESAARQLIDGWYGCRYDVYQGLFPDAWQRFTACERPWKE